MKRFYFFLFFISVVIGAKAKVSPCVPATILSDPRDSSVCNNNAVSFYVEATGDNLIFQWQLSLDGGLTWNSLAAAGIYPSVTSATLTITNADETMDGNLYRAYVTGDCGSDTSDQAVLSVFPTTTLTAGASLNPVCSNMQTTIDISGAVTYTISNGVVNHQAFFPLATRTYSVSATDGNGCLATDTITIITKAAPTVTASATNYAVCQGQTTKVIANGSFVGAAALDQSQPGIGFYETAGVSTRIGQSFIAEASGSLDTITVNFQAFNTTNGNINLTVFKGAGYGGQQLYTSAYSNLSVGINSLALGGVSVTSGSVYTFGIYTTGSTTSANLYIGPGGATDYSNGSLYYAGSLSNAGTTFSEDLYFKTFVSAQLTYSWTNGVFNDSSFVPAATNTYVVSATANGCVSKDSVAISVNAKPVVTFDLSQNTYCASDPSFTLSASPAGGVFSGNGVAGDVFDPSSAGTGAHTLSYLYTAPDNCSNNDTANIAVNSCTTSLKGAGNSFFKLYPNPSKGKVKVEASEESMVLIYNATGQNVYSQLISAPVEELTISLPKGIYLFRVLNSSFAHTQQLIIEE